jgi:hypothetical protein
MDDPADGEVEGELPVLPVKQPVRPSARSPNPQAAAGKTLHVVLGMFL